jgi:hypothetical protein
MAIAGEGDEISVIDGFVLRLEIGRPVYGPLDLRVDRRDWDRESDEEIADWAVYRALKRTSRRMEEIAAIEEGLGELRGTCSEIFDVSDQEPG